MPDHPFDLPWPRSTERTVLRLLTMDDVDAMHAYRSLPQVCRFLNHEPLDRAGVERRIRSRLPEHQSGDDLTCGVAVEVGSRMVGDAMLRVHRRADDLWVGFGFHPSVWGHGQASEVATELVRIGRELDLRVWADAFEDNTASRRVLIRAGLVEQHARAGRRVFAGPPPR